MRFCRNPAAAQPQGSYESILPAFRIATNACSYPGVLRGVGRFLIGNQWPRFLTGVSAKADFPTTQCTQTQCSRLD